VRACTAVSSPPRWCMQACAVARSREGAAAAASASASTTSRISRDAFVAFCRRSADVRSWLTYFEGLVLLLSSPPPTAGLLEGFPEVPAGADLPREIVEDGAVRASAGRPPCSATAAQRAPLLFARLPCAVSVENRCRGGVHGPGDVLRHGPARPCRHVAVAAGRSRVRRWCRRSTSVPGFEELALGCQP
jgi:hypothetical protein